MDNKKKKNNLIQYVADPITTTAIINQANGISISEGGEQKAKRLFTNPQHSYKIKTFAILTFYNRDKKTQSKKDNTNQNKLLKGYLGNKDNIKIDDKIVELERILKQKTPYYKAKGKYGDKEQSLIIYNISFNEAYRLAQLGGQQSFIWGTNDNGILKFEFWANASKTEGKYIYKKVDERDKFNILDNDVEDYYTQISRDFKFNIPFEQFEVSQDELIERYNNSGLNDDEIDYFINESMDDDYNEKYKLNCRLRLTKGIMNKEGN